MRFYFAGSFKRRAELIAYMQQLELMGHNVTSRWLKTEHEVDVVTDDELSPSGPAFQFATEDIEDILLADAVVFFSSADHPAKGRGGRHTEFGISYSEHKAIFLIGRRENAFHSLVPDRNVFYDFRAFELGIDYVIDEIKMQAQLTRE